MAREISPGRIKAARVIAGVADLLQIVLFPLFFEGGLSPFDAALDVVMGGLMIWLVGFHWAFLPSFVAEVIPVFDMVPTWTIAVLIATRGGPVGPDGKPIGPASDSAAPSDGPGSGPGKVTDVDVSKP